MATIRNVISYVDAIKPNAFDEGVKVQWVNEVEGYIQTEVMMLALADTVQYDPDVHMDTVLLVKPPHDKLYALYLCALVDFANGEYDKYNNTMQMYNKFLGEYIKWYTRVFHPADGGCVREGYYLSAYTIATRHGFEGTEEEWLESLKGDPGEPFEYDDFTQEQLEALRGPAGRDIVSFDRTSGDGTAGSVDTYTITYSSGPASNFEVRNGSNGITPHIGSNGNWYIGNTDTGVFADGGDIFLAVYGETAFDAVKAAYDAGKYIYVINTNQYAPLAVTNGTTLFRFATVAGDVTRILAVSQAGGWSTTEYAILPASHNTDPAAHQDMLKTLYDNIRALYDAIVIPTKLPNPYALTFTGAASDTYDGSSAVTIEIPTGGGETVATEVYMRVSGGYIQYSTDNATWKNVIAVADLKGNKGDPGQDGEDGQDGAPGTDGFSPTVTVQQTDTGAVITITDKTSTTTATVSNGENYNLTEADKKEIADMVDASGGGSSLPDITEENEGDVLSVVNGVPGWNPIPKAFVQVELIKDESGYVLPDEWTYTALKTAIENGTLVALKHNATLFRYIGYDLVENGPLAFASYKSGGYTVLAVSVYSSITVNEYYYSSGTTEYIRVYTSNNVWYCTKTFAEIQELVDRGMRCVVYATYTNGDRREYQYAGKLDGNVHLFTYVNSNNIYMVKVADDGTVSSTYAALAYRARKINGHTLEADFNLTAEDVGAVSTTTTEDTEGMILRSVGGNAVWSDEVFDEETKTEIVNAVLDALPTWEGGNF